MNTASSKPNTLIAAIPAAAKSRLTTIGLGWILIAALEAWAYTMLALAIWQQRSPTWVLISALITMIITVIVTRSGYLTGVRLAGDLFAALGQALASAKLSWFNDQRRALISKMAGQEIPNFMSIPAHQFQTFLYSPCLPLFICIGVGVLAGIGAMLVAFIIVLASFGLQLYAQYALNQTDAKRNQAELNTSTATLALVEHLQLLRTAAGPLRALTTINQHWQHQEHLLAKINHSAAWAQFIATLASIVPIAAMAIYWLAVAETNAYLILSSLLLMSRAGAPLQGLASAGLSVNDLLGSLRHFQQLTNPPKLLESSTTAIPSHQQLSLHNVTYASQSTPINLEIPLGARVHVSGVSGSGKSTLLQLLMRFDDPAQGEIKLGDKPLWQIPYHTLAQNIAYVAQKPIIITGSLADNIRLGRFDASDAEIEAIARQSLLGHVIDRAEEGIHQSVGQQGSALSGGEQQRLAIARAMLKGAPILILDEATAALDEATEQQLIDVICQQCQTLIFVTHRASNPWQPTHKIDLPEPTPTTP